MKRRTREKMRRVGIVTALLLSMCIGGRPGWASETSRQDFGVTWEEMEESIVAFTDDREAEKNLPFQKNTSIAHVSKAILEEHGTSETDPSGESTSDRNSSGESTSDRNPSGESTSDRNSSGESTSDRNSSGENTSDISSSGENLSDIEPSGEYTSNRNPSEESTSDTGPSAEGTSETNPNEENTSEADPSRESTSDSNPYEQASSDIDLFHNSETDPEKPSESGAEEEGIPETAELPEMSPLAQEYRMKMNVAPDQTEVKAGKTVTFDVELQNEGAAAFTKLHLQSILSREEIHAVWQAADGFSVTGEYGMALLDILNPGENRHLTLTMEIPEDQTDPIENMIRVIGTDPVSEKETIICRRTVCTTILPIKTDFKVEKTADRLAAAAGDTIRYQITISNTGERTLHSVLSTERFQLAEVSAQFVKKEGVLINADRTQAYISQIAPGEAVQLEALVQIPKDISAQKLVNQVVVTTKETGDSEILSEAVVEITKETEVPQETVETGGGSQSGFSAPKTGDDSTPGRFLGLLTASVLLILCLTLYSRKTRSQKE